MHLATNFMRLATEHHINLELMHRITTMSAGTLDALPHNGTVLLLLQISGLTHGESYLRHGDDRDRQLHHCTRCCPDTWLGFWIVLTATLLVFGPELVVGCEIGLHRSGCSPD